MKENIHAGHRNRLRSEILASSDPTNIPEHKLLEMLLFYGIPQKDTNLIAHELIDKFGSFSAVFEADAAELAAVKGMTKNAAALIKLMIPLAKIYIKQRYEPSHIFTNINDIGNYIFMQYLGVTNERLCVMFLDDLGKMLAFETVSEGSMEAVGVNIRTIAQRALQLKSNLIILAHNHPGSIAVPSAEDVAITANCKEALNLLSIRICDHIIVGADDFVSMAQSNEYRELFNR